ncbi:VanZ family protein [Halorhabdus salina]|uniref:VanZ family protein n=1 Tax=Halorhabdus salina TaxID=2750670 RepID=UPI0015EE7F4F|nr:VanZ family protein [Halorhabdus salina]
MSGLLGGVPRTVRWLLAVVIAAVIFLGSVLDPGAGIARSGPFGLASRATWAHLGGYAVLTFSVRYALLDSRFETTVSTAMAPIAVIVFGVLIEFVQATLAYRTFAVGDMLTNAVGALLATVVWSLARHAMGVLEVRRS